jgi:hypothetical protein
MQDFALNVYDLLHCRLTNVLASGGKNCAGLCNIENRSDWNGVPDWARRVEGTGLRLVLSAEIAS